MGRRSEHTRAELEGLIVAEGFRQLEERGLGAFSVRDVAKRIGYSIGTVYHLFGSYDGVMLAINARTLELWREQAEARLATASGPDRMTALVHGYFEFAALHTKAWLAIFEHHMADGGEAPDWFREKARALIAIVVRELGAVLPGVEADFAVELAHSLVATVHGHCLFEHHRIFEMLGDPRTSPAETALARVREALSVAAAGRRPGRPPSPEHSRLS
jgi:AcrR family transcriptional regulator